MKLYKLQIENFRLLKNFSMDLEDVLSLVIGKNNCGKTSVAQILNKFLKSKKESISYDDFNLAFRDELEQLLKSEEITEEDYNKVNMGIKLRLYIKYNETDDLSVAGYIIKDLAPECDVIVLGFDYVLLYDDYKKLRTAYRSYISKETETDSKLKGMSISDLETTHKKWLDDKSHNYLERWQKSFFHLIKKTIAFDWVNNCPKEDDYTLFSDIPQFRLENFIKYDYIEAKRHVDNDNDDKTLSSLTADLYDANTPDIANDTLNNFQLKLVEMDDALTSVYSEMFGDIISTVSKFGGLYPNDTSINVLSWLQHKDLLKGNTKVVYSASDRTLPESYNGLGYMNLIAMIFQIEIIRQQFIGEKGKRMADINILLIEEPEAHTHPQMQYVFIKNVKKLIDKGITKDGVTRKYQTIISTHSSHIVAESNFDDIKYLRRSDDDCSVQAENLKDLKALYKDKKYFAFLKQYLTINRSELFFADKAIFIEGDTERILMPAFMKKIDDDFPVNIKKGELPLLSQNISIIEVGAYSQVFAEFINFIGLQKAVVFTDLDIAEKPNGGSQEYNSSEVQYTTNSSLKYYFGKDKKISEYVELAQADKYFCWDSIEKKWKPDTTDNSNMMVCYETMENGYQPSSFEDCFISANPNFFKSNDFKIGFKEESLQRYKEDIRSVYSLAREGVKSKASLAVEILLNGTPVEDKKDNFVEWNLPNYIKEGLIWLRQ